MPRGKHPYAGMILMILDGYLESASMENSNCACLALDWTLWNIIDICAITREGGAEGI